MKLILIAVLSLAACAATESPSTTPLAQLDDRQDDGVSVGTADWLGNRDRSWVLDCWGLTRGSSLTTSGKVFADGGLAIKIRTSHGFTGTDLMLELHRQSKGELEARVEVEMWSDESAPKVWKKPTGSVLVSSEDWSALNESGTPLLIVEFRLYDVPMREGWCLHGVVEIPRPWESQ